jgi:molybdenum cofactor cytidylyltransferase
MGHPKAHLPFRGGTFLSVIAETMGRRCSPVIAVFGFDAERLRQSAPQGVVTVTNPEFQHGMLTSLQVGLRAVPPNHNVVLFTLVDHPAVSPETVDAVMRSKAAIAIPRYRSKRGHPVLLRQPVTDEFLLEPHSSKIRDVIDRHASEIEYVDVSDPGIADDIDDRELYQRLLLREATSQ